MNRMKYILALGLAALAFGCPARSLFPLFAEKDLAALPAIAGTWIDAKGDTISIQPAPNKSYRVTFHNKKGETARYTGLVGKLGSSWFLDSYPAYEVADDHFIPSHYISKIRIEGDSCWISSLEGDWLTKMTKAGTLQIPLVKIPLAKRGDNVILTASTEELQHLALRYGDDTEAFPVKDKPMVRLKR